MCSFMTDRMLKLGQIKVVFFLHQMNYTTQKYSIGGTTVPCYNDVGVIGEDVGFSVLFLIDAC